MTATTVEDLAARLAADAEEFVATAPPLTAEDKDLLLAVVRPLAARTTRKEAA